MKSFTLRLPPETHQQLKLDALRLQISMKQLLTSLINDYLGDKNL